MRRVASPAIVCVALVACGRVAFEPIDQRTGDGGIGDTPAGTQDAADASMVPAGLVAWWKLDEGQGSAASDSAGTANALLVAGGGAMPPTWSASGHSGPSVMFAGDGDRIDILSPAALVNLPALTVSAWINPTSVAADGSLHCVFTKGNGSAGWELLVGAATAGSISFDAYYSGSIAGRDSKTATVAAGTWSHVVATWTGDTASTSIRLYVNGLETTYATGSDGVGARPDDSAVPAAINCVALSGLPGLIDDVMIWNRVLAPAEVAAL